MISAIRKGAEQVFSRFLFEAVNYLRPEGGSQALTITVDVRENKGRGYLTTIELREVDVVGSMKILLRAEIRG